MCKRRAKVLRVLLKTLAFCLQFDLTLLSGMQPRFSLTQLHIDLWKISPFTSNLLFYLEETFTRLALTMFKIHASSVDRLDLDSIPVGNGELLRYRGTGTGQRLTLLCNVCTGRLQYGQCLCCSDLLLLVLCCRLSYLRINHCGAFAQ